MDRKELWLLLKGRCKRMTLWSTFLSDKKMRSPQQRTHKIPLTNQRASFCTWQKASYSIEAAIVIPSLAGYFVTILFFFQILQIQCLVDEALFYAGRKTAVESSVVESEELLFLSAEAYLLYVLEEEPLIEKYIENGVWGIYLWESSFEGDYIFLKANYTIKFPIQFFGLGEVELTSQNTFRKWNNPIEVEEAEEGFVYVTPSGEVYHTGTGCRVLKLSIQESTLEEISNIRGASGQKYYECPSCDWEENMIERVYYTNYGVLFHKSISCSSLKRTIEKIGIEEIGDRRPCSFCYGL